MFPLPTRSLPPKRSVAGQAEGSQDSVLCSIFQKKVWKKCWRTILKKSWWFSFLFEEALWNLLCAIDWDPQSKFKNGVLTSVKHLATAQVVVEYSSSWITRFWTLFGEFDPGSEWTLAAWLRHASRTVFIEAQADIKAVANGCVTREQSTFKWGIARRKAN